MGFRITIKQSSDTKNGDKNDARNGTPDIVLGKEDITIVRTMLDSEDDNNAKGNHVNIIAHIEGKILAPSDNKKHVQTKQVSNQAYLDGTVSIAYRHVIIEVIANGTVVRKYELPNAYVIDYMEDFSDSSGNGKFSLTIRQKKDKIKDIDIKGNYTLPVEQ